MGACARVRFAPPPDMWRARSEVEHDRDRPVVDELELHPRAEDARLDADSEFAQRGGEPLVDRLGDVRPRGGGERRSIPLSRLLLTSEVNCKLEAS